MRSSRLAAIACLAVASLTGCSRMPSLTDDLATIDRIERECRTFGLVRQPASLVLDIIPVPGVKLAAELIAIGLDQVCADPARFAHDEGVAIWIINNAMQ